MWYHNKHAASKYVVFPVEGSVTQNVATKGLRLDCPQTHVKLKRLSSCCYCSQVRGSLLVSVILHNPATKYVSNLISPDHPFYLFIALIFLYRNDIFFLNFRFHKLKNLYLENYNTIRNWSWSQMLFTLGSLSIEISAVTPSGLCCHSHTSTIIFS